MINIAVCDDDLGYFQSALRPVLSKALKESGLEAKISFFADGNKLLHDFENHKLYDVVLLDIDMPDINGKKLAEKLRIIDSKFFLVFITSYNAEVYNTIPYRINAFIPKSSEECIFISEFKRVFADYIKFKPKYDIFTISNNGKKETIKILANDIFYFYCAGRISHLATGKEELILSADRFSDITDKYTNKGFFEICRGYIVNISKIKLVKADEVILDNGVLLPLSRGKYKPLLKKLSDNINLRTE